MNFNGHNVRHGDLALIGVNALPAGLTASDTKVLMTGSGGNDHIVENGTVYPKAEGQFIIGYLDAQKGCRLLHPDHGKKGKGVLRTVPLAEGIYELRRQNEQTHESFRPVVD